MSHSVCFYRWALRWLSDWLSDWSWRLSDWLFCLFRRDIQCLFWRDILGWPHMVRNSGTNLLHRCIHKFVRYLPILRPHQALFVIKNTQVLYINLMIHPRRLLKLKWGHIVHWVCYSRTHEVSFFAYGIYFLSHGTICLGALILPILITFFNPFM